MTEGLLYLIFGGVGAAIGSFINTLGPRYSKRKGFEAAMRGRSKCPQCGKQLRWYEIIPIFSFLFQGGQCRHCGGKIPRAYELVEILATAVAVAVPWRLGFTFPAGVWLLALWVLILISVIDLRLKIIPDELVTLLGLLGLANIIWRQVVVQTGEFVALKGASFIGHYALVFTLGDNLWINHLLAVGFGLALFGALYFFSKGKAMGLGDVKLAAALGTLVVWPDIVLALTLPFIVGSLVGLVMITAGKASMKSNIPFGPYIALGVTLLFFFGYDIVNGYFQLFGIF